MDPMGLGLLGPWEPTISTKMIQDATRQIPISSAGEQPRHSRWHGYQGKWLREPCWFRSLKKQRHHGYDLLGVWDTPMPKFTRQVSAMMSSFRKNRGSNASHCRPCQALIAALLCQQLHLTDLTSLTSLTTFGQASMTWEVKRNSSHSSFFGAKSWVQMSVKPDETSTNLKWLPSIPGVLVDAVVCRLHMAQKAWTILDMAIV